MNKDLKINLLEKSTKAKDIYIDNSKAISKLSYLPRTIEDGLKRYLREFNYEI